MSLQTTLAAGREAWLGLATDTCRVTRTAKAGDDEYVAQVMDPVTRRYPTQGRVTVYEGPCRVQVKVDINSNVVETTAGDREATYYVGQLQVPVVTPDDATGSVDDIDVDFIAEILTAPEAPSLSGSQFNIHGSISHKSHAVYTRWRIREVAA